MDKYCGGCGKKNPRGGVSRRGLCVKCSQDRQKDAIAQIRRREGPIYEKWQRAKEGGAS